MFERASRPKASSSGIDELSKATSLNNLAVLQGKLGDYASAERFFQEAMDLLRFNEGASAALQLAGVEDNYGRAAWPPYL